MSGNKPGWLERWVVARNRVLSSPRFQRWAAATPGMNLVARARSAAIFDLVAGFVYTQVTAAFVELDLPAFLLEDVRTLDLVAHQTGLAPELALRLMRAAAALDLAEEVAPGRWSLGQRGAALAGTRGVAEMIAHHRALYADLADPIALFRRGGGGGQLSGYWPYAEEQEGARHAAATYSALMAASQPMVAEQVLAAYDFGRHRRLLDVGGGEGAFLDAVAARWPQLALGLFDLPPVAERARRRLGPLVDVHGGSFREQALPAGADIVSLVRICHDHDDDLVRIILSRVFEALPAGGRILIAEPLAEAPGAEPMGHAYFGLYLLAMGSGRPRSAAEYRAMLHAAGFAGVTEHATQLPLVTGVITATRPEKV